MATCPLGNHSKSHLITPHCVLYYASLAVNTAHFVNSDCVDSVLNRFTKLNTHTHTDSKGSKLDELMKLFIAILLQLLIIFLTLLSSITFVIYFLFYCCIILWIILSEFYDLYIVFVKCLCLNVLHIWHCCSEIPHSCSSAEISVIHTDAEYYPVTQSPI